MNDRLTACLALSLLPLASLACDAQSQAAAPTPSATAPASAPTAAAPSTTSLAAPPTAAFATKPPQEPPQQPAPADVAAAPTDATKTASGLASKVITKGKGKDHPTRDDKVKVHYTGWTTDGKMFDSSVGSEPITFGLGQVIKGWTEGLQLMVEGEKRRLWIPKNLAYGDRPRMGAPAGDLVFDVELLQVIPAPKPPTTPEDVKAPPASATKTKSGLAYRVLKKGTGTTSPSASDAVTVNYSGWTTDGKMFDSSITRGEPATFPLNGVIKGWTEGVALMHVGDVVRFWIPGDLAYGDKPTRPGAPSGTLVFDIELLDIKGHAPR